MPKQNYDYRSGRYIPLRPEPPIIKRVRPRRKPIAGGRKKKSLKPEEKYIDVALVSRALTAPTDCTGGMCDPTTVNCLNAVSPGTGYNQYVGVKYVMKSVLITGMINIPIQTGSATLDEATSIFVALVWDKQTDGTQCNSESIFTNTGASAILATNPTRQARNTKRFKVLGVYNYDPAFPPITWNGTGTTKDQGGIRHRFWLFRNINIEVQTFTGTGQVGDIVDNSLHMVAYCSNTGLAPTLSYNCRIKFTDV